MAQQGLKPWLKALFVRTGLRTVRIQVFFIVFLSLPMIEGDLTQALKQHPSIFFSNTERCENTNFRLEIWH